MHYPAVVTIKNRRVTKSGGIFAGVHLNAPAGVYNVLGVVQNGAFVELPIISKGRPFARIISVEPGVLAVIEPQEVIRVEGAPNA